VLNGNYLVQYASCDETQSAQSVVFLSHHTVRESSTPADSYSTDDTSQRKFSFEISTCTAGEKLTHRVWNIAPIVDYGTAKTSCKGV